MHYDPDLIGMAERALKRHVVGEHPDAIITRGILISEFLDPASEFRGVLTVSFGRQGVLQPYEIIGLVAPVQIAASSQVANALFGFRETDD